VLKFYTILPDNDDLRGARQATKISILLEELGEEFETIDMDRRNEVRPLGSEYRKKLNPNGRVPAIDDDGFVLWEVGAILNYIVSTREGGKYLRPESPKERAICDQWLYWEGTTLTPDLIAYLTLLTSMDASFVASDLEAMVLAAGGAPFLLIGNDKEKDEAALEQARNMAKFNFGMLDSRLDGQDYILGDFSIADIALGVVTAIFLMGDIKMQPFKNVSAWLLRLAERPSFKNTSSYMDHIHSAQKAGRLSGSAQ